MAAHRLDVALDNRRLDEPQLAPLIAAWRAGESPSLRLSEKTPPSPALKRARAALRAGTTWDSRPKPDAPLAETALEFAKAFPLLPIPVVASPLYMVLSDTDAQAGEYPAIVNSFAQLRFFAWAEKIIFEATEEVGKAKRQKAREEMHKTMFEVARQAFVSFGKICLLPQELANEQIHMELFYNNLNAVRILEFTILDYLATDTTRQTALVTPDYFWLPTKAPAPATPPAVYAEIRADLASALSALSQRVGERPAWTELAAAYDPQRLTPQVPAVKLFLREALSQRLFACQNREGNCTKQESAKGEFKSCARCGWFRYCSKECQATHWRLGHKTKCGSADVKAEIPRIIIAADTDTDEPRSNKTK